MPFEELAQRMNWVDATLVLVLLLFGVAGLSRGFLIGALDLAGLGVAFAVAQYGYRDVSEQLLLLREMPVTVAMFGAFIGLFLVSQIVYAIFVNLVFHV